jgi:hypothetical protein
MIAPSRHASFAVLLLACAACVRGEKPLADSASTSSSTATPNSGATGATSPARPGDSLAFPPSGTVEWTVRGDGVRGAILGQTSAMTRVAFGLGRAPAFRSGSCEYLNPPGTPVMLMFVSDTLVRVDVRDGSVTTAEGARVGDTEARIEELYAGRVTTTPHKYTGPTGHYLTVSVPSLPANLLVFETDGRRVTLYRVGRKPEVEWVEGCA